MFGPIRSTQGEGDLQSFDLRIMAMMEASLFSLCQYICYAL